MEQKNNVKPLKYIGYSIVCQEVPNEISLAFNISGCKHKCKDCHSKYLWEYKGEYLGQDLLKVLSNYKDLITCVCFLGGDQNIKELFELCNIVKKHNLKTCIYSGEEDIDFFSELLNQNLLDYLKLGKYDAACGALNNVNTNQIMYKINDSELIDITYEFQKVKR